MNSWFCFDLQISAKINRPFLQSYPKTDGRAFRSQWFANFEWLEYNPDIDACYCYACCIFATGTEMKDVAFIKTEFKS